MFDLTWRGRPATREELFPDWGLHDRLGVVMTEPFGAVGASHLIQLSITAFYDARPSRRSGRRDGKDPRAIYPEIYLFHVGDRYGDHSAFDFRPARKEVFLERDARQVLDAINDRAITRLAVPDGDPIAIQHEWKEPAAARDRIVTAWAYSADGRVRDADWMVTGLSPSTERNIKMTLDPALRYASFSIHADIVNVVDPGLIARDYGLLTEQRRDEGMDGIEVANLRREAIRKDGLASETYRSLTVDEALEMLV